MPALPYAPCLPTLVKKPPVGPEWLHEIKWDGYRFVCHLNGGKVRMMTRNALDWSSNFPAIVDAIRRLPAKSAIVDGEAAILDDSGVSHFSSFSRPSRRVVGRPGEPSCTPSIFWSSTARISAKSRW